MKRYAVICHTFGRKFSFEAEQKAIAERKMREWARYHGHNPSEYHVHQIPIDDELNDLHNEYVADL